MTDSPTIVFDFGGVLFDFQGERVIATYSRNGECREGVQRTWGDLARSFESGNGEPTDFAQSIIDAYALDISIEDFLAAFRAAAVGFYPGALALVQMVAVKNRVVSLSNTNSIQWPVVLAHLGLTDPFWCHFPSHLIGAHKPDLRAFQAVERHMAGDRFVFLDDCSENVVAAQAHGWEACRVHGVVDAAQALAKLGLLA